MICPHCDASLLRRERPDNVCGKCGRRYALDPKTNPLELSDLRVRRVVAKLTDDGRLPCTPGHLWYALSRRSLRPRRIGGGCVAVVLLGAFLLTAGYFAGPAPLAYFGLVLALLAPVLCVLAVVAGGRGRPKVLPGAFRGDVLEPWVEVYGGLPPGVVDDRRYPAPGGESGAGQATTLLCPDLSVATLIAAAGLPERHGLLLVRDLPEVPARGPVIVLHDVSAPGLVLPWRVREALPGRRVIDAGVPLRAVRGLPNAVPYRDRQPDQAVLTRLAEVGDYTSDELAWLRKGWTYPLVAIPPGRLLDVVSRVAERVGRAASADQGRAAAVGFLTWPDEGAP
ncbi:hypothetical protein [Streptomyces buecherae]|uniref:Uncharacterized protein n=1 Tax=Streptomyces buecherae TaxID=2763006 RepID=A0A7H8N1M2_9ACTN|nr:hypothetical protein [Streptomyces buecherae]QKW48312.1 hypothetical protein HUT08_00770 [Streptomyces buecherae]